MVQTRDASLTMPFAEASECARWWPGSRNEGSTLVESQSTVRRPWGSYCVLEEGPRFRSSASWSLPGPGCPNRCTTTRSEHWVVVEGTAVVEVNGEDGVWWRTSPWTFPRRHPSPGQSRQGAPGDHQIQSGPYLGEDDIVRFDDVYGRRKNED
jgi:mannose-1-phosphate guanylyltransferase/mannose-6-phosphate isomerase